MTASVVFIYVANICYNCISIVPYAISSAKSVELFKWKNIEKKKNRVPIKISSVFILISKVLFLKKVLKIKKLNDGKNK